MSSGLILVVADTLRVLNDGERLQNLKVRLGSLSGRSSDPHCQAR